MPYAWSQDDNQRAIPTVPGQRPAQPADDWDASVALTLRFPDQGDQSDQS
jgi:hypothetical protein